MAKDLKNLNDWPERAKNGGYNVKTVAAAVGVSRWTLRIFFKKKGFPGTPKKCFELWRARHAEALKAAGMVGKEISEKVGLSNPGSLTRAMNRALGHGLRRPPR